MITRDLAYYAQKMIEDDLLEKDNVVSLCVREVQNGVGEIASHVVEVGVLSMGKIDSDYQRYFTTLDSGGMPVSINVRYVETDMPKALDFKAFSPLQRRSYSTASVKPLVTPFRLGLSSPKGLAAQALLKGLSAFRR